MKEYFCKECNSPISYKSKSGFCKSCCRLGERHHYYGKKFLLEHCNKLKNSKVGKKNPNYGKKFSIEHCRKISLGKKGIGHKHSPETIEKLRKSHIGKKFTDEHIKNLGDSHKGINHQNYGKKLPVKTKKRMRLSAIKRIEKEKFNGNQIVPNFNPKACKMIDKYGKKYGYNFQHAMNGGEFYIKNLGYWVDGYDKDENVVIEYYENKHDYNLYKDFDREIEICNKLLCDFIILWEKNYNV